jgi:hypothetical protein
MIEPERHLNMLTWHFFSQCAVGKAAAPALAQTGRRRSSYAAQPSA